MNADLQINQVGTINITHDNRSVFTLFIRSLPEKTLQCIFGWISSSSSHCTISTDIGKNYYINRWFGKHTLRNCYLLQDLHNTIFLPQYIYIYNYKPVVPFLPCYWRLPITTKEGFSYEKHHYNFSYTRIGYNRMIADLCFV